MYVMIAALIITMENHMAKNVKKDGKGEKPNPRPAKDAKKSERGEGGFRSNAFKRKGGSRG